MLEGRRAFAKSLWHGHWLFKAVGIMWAALTVAQTILPFLPQEWSSWFYGLHYFPKWPWYIWIIGLLLFLVIAIFEGGYSQVQQQNQKEASGGPNLILGYVDSSFGGGVLAIRNLGPGIAYNVSLGICYRSFEARFSEINFVEAKQSGDQQSGVNYFQSPNNMVSKNSLLDGLMQFQEPDDPNWHVSIPATLRFDAVGRRFEYQYELECHPFYKMAQFKFKRPVFLGYT